MITLSKRRNRSIRVTQITGWLLGVVVFAAMVFGPQPEALAESEKLYWLFSRWKKSEDIAINLEKGLAASKTRGSWHSGQWYLEPTGDGYYRIRSRWKPSLYINIEKGLKASQIKKDWISAQWKLTKGGKDEKYGTFYRIQSRWKPNLHLNIEKGFECSAIKDSWHSAHWFLFGVKLGAKPKASKKKTKAVKQPALKSTGSKISVAGARNVVAWHNKYRAEVGVGGLVWSAKVAAFACGFRKFWPPFSGNYGRFLLGLPGCLGVQVTRPYRGSIQDDEATALQGTIDDGLCQVRVV